MSFIEIVFLVDILLVVALVVLRIVVKRKGLKYEKKKRAHFHTDSGSSSCDDFSGSSR